MTTYIAVINHETSDETELFCQIAYQQFNCLGTEEINLLEQEIESLWPGEAGPFVLHQLPQDANDRLMSQVQPTKYYFASPLELNAFTDVAKAHGVSSIKEDVLEDQDWNAEWKKHYEPIVISDNFRIVPSWFDNINPHDLVIYPGQGFGTGSHETTYLCLKLLSDYKNIFNNSVKVLDFGCGSGILGIATKKILNSEVVYCDIDASALDNTKQNIILNGLSEFNDIVVTRDQLPSTLKYDLVFANILYAALVEEYTIITSGLIENGILILSGLLNNQVDDLLKVYNHDFNLIEVRSKCDWSAILLKRK